MANIPTLTELRNRIIDDLETSLSINIPVFGKLFIRALAGVQAGKLWITYLSLARVQKNIFPDLSDDEMLLRQGRVKLNRSPRAAVAGQYEIEITGTVGATVPVNTVFKSDDDALNAGQLYILDAAYTLVSATDTITVRGLTGGLDSQLNTGDTLTSTSPIINVSENAEVIAEAVEPRAAESMELYRTRVLEAFILEPQGGAPSDYRLWSDVQGVQSAYPYPVIGQPNTVEVYIEATTADSTDGKGTPSATLLSDVEDSIETNDDTGLQRRPITVFTLDVKSVTPLDVTVEVTGYQNLTSDKQTTIENALRAYINTVRPFVAGIDSVNDRNDTLNEFKVGKIIDNAVPSSLFTSLDITVGGTSFTTYQFEDGEIAYFDSLTFV